MIDASKIKLVYGIAWSTLSMIGLPLLWFIGATSSFRANLETSGLFHWWIIPWLLVVMASGQGVIGWYLNRRSVLEQARDRRRSLKEDGGATRQP